MKNKYDVIIVGTGVAGCFTALHLPGDMEILMITKGDLEESDSFLAHVLSRQRISTIVVLVTTVFPFLS